MQENAWPRVSEKEIESVIAWIRDYLGADRKAVVGISGGVDSAVVLALCLRAVGMDRVLTAYMPCGASSSADGPFVMDLVDRYHISCPTVNIEPALSALLYALPIMATPVLPVAAGNIKARLRMTTLYAIAGANNGIVVGTTNMSEYAVGYATKYGDHGVDIEPIQEFYKTEVFDMARTLGVPESIINRAPTANLWEGQTDEKELGVSYADLDDQLRHLYPITRKTATMVVQSMHKRSVPPSYRREQ